MKISGDLIEGVFVRRENRFRCLVKTGGSTFAAHMPNSGRMTELLMPGSRCVLRLASNPNRKTSLDFLQVEHQGHWVGVDSRMPPSLLLEALEKELLPDFRGWKLADREPAFGSGRADLLMKCDDDLMFVETKSVNLVIDGTALFPDAPTARGTRHVTELAEHVKNGGRAAVVFVVQRPDAAAVRPHADADPGFAAACRVAHEAGLPFYGISCETGIGSLVPASRIQVLLA